MSRSLIARRQEAERARIEAFEASLRRVSQRTRSPPDFEQAIDDAKRGFEREIVRDAWAFRPQMKTRDTARLRLAAARHLFARYSVADHLERIWIDQSGLGRDEILLRRRWYIVAAGGGSLYKTEAGSWLSRKEVHAFLNPPARLSFEQAVWQSIARSYTDDLGIALRIARSSIAQAPRTELGFWREVVRFFCVNPTTAEEIGDLRDYLSECRRRNPEYALKGRTLAVLRRQLREWHQDLAAIARIEEARRRVEAQRARARGEVWPVGTPADGSWPGAQISNWSWMPSAKEQPDRSKREEFLVVQLKTAVDLVSETRAMHHCVSTYASKCIAGHASIWSLRRRAAGTTSRLLTIELDRQHRAIQVRGFANRPALPEERKLLARWAKSSGIVLLQ